MSRFLSAVPRAVRQVCVLALIAGGVTASAFASTGTSGTALLPSAPEAVGAAASAASVQDMATQDVVPPTAADYSRQYAADVKRVLELDEATVTNYSKQLQQALSDKPDAQTRSQFFILVDRNPKAQRLMLFLGTTEHLELVGASPISSGNTGRFDYYITPLGVFEHTLKADFRAEGTKNEHGIRGYGSRGMRIWDFGWYPATKGWAKAAGGEGEIRFQMHATDPAILEPKVGAPGSKGCVRVPESLNKFLDTHGVLDYAYAEAVKVDGKRPWVWNKSFKPTGQEGRYLVVVDSAEAPFGR